jgi:hypothetical protein
MAKRTTKRTKTSTKRKAVKRKPKVTGKGMRVQWPKSWAASWAEHQTKLATAKLDKTAQELRAAVNIDLINRVTR